MLILHMLLPDSRNDSVQASQEQSKVLSRYHSRLSINPKLCAPMPTTENAKKRMQVCLSLAFCSDDVSQHLFNATKKE